ncbi:peroxidase 3-like [Solanum dulcamara]|uniref:peroxidase 3-like n=1 Tax=Solanum dulcamara TaxID=45834 RepID=UPI002485E18A|nr:peroxidase 3-like [Solanum dulcamara]
MARIVGSSHAQLQLNFYAKSCPQAEKIIQDYVQKQIPNAPCLAAALLRLHFHDCFVRASCDGSVLLNFTSSTKNQTEKVAVPNQTLRSFSFIDGVKKAVETECPGTVFAYSRILLRPLNRAEVIVEAVDRKPR